jgi:hypothetical protein
VKSFTPDGILRMQIAALDQDLQGLSGTLGELRFDDAPEAAGAGDLRPRFEKLVQRLRSELAELDERIGKRPKGEALEDAWHSLRDLSARADRVSTDYLRCLQGAMIRRQGLDSGWLDVSDHMLRRVGHASDVQWSRVTVLNEGELLAGLTDVVGARFGSFDIWNLPIAVHELGHYVAANLEEAETGRPIFEEVVKGLQKRAREESAARPDGTSLERKLERLQRHANELFADLFAVYVLGPAYVFTCVLLRFDPAAAYQATSDHPSDDDRCRALLAMLVAMDAAAYRKVADLLGDLWADSLGAAGLEAKGAAGSGLAAWAVELIHPALRHNLPPAARYAGWASAVALAGELEGSAPVGQIDLGAAGIADVLNAAWLARWRKPDDAAEISARALALARASLLGSAAAKR